MDLRSRRQFLVEVGRGMITASVGLATATELGLAAPCRWQDPERLSFGPLEPLVELLTDTPVEGLQAVVLDRLRAGTSLREVVTAAALANARTFGGEDYVGYHTMMALAPAYRMALELPQARAPLPVLKVLWRNAARLQAFGGSRNEVLRPVAPAEGQPEPLALRAAVRERDLAAAERIFAELARRDAGTAFDALLHEVQDATEVHRVVLPHRAWDLLAVIGMEHAHTLLRQSVHYCVKSEPRVPERDSPCRALLPRLLEQHGLLAKAPGTRAADDAWIERTSRSIFESTREVAAEAVAAALADGIAPRDVGEAIALASNQLLLRDHGRTEKEAQPGKPIGSVHGDSIGLHACDATNAWRGMAAAGSARHTFASLILGAWQSAHDRVNRGGDFLRWEPLPRPEQLAQVEAQDGAGLLGELDAAIRGNDQGRAVAAMHRYGELDLPPRPAFDLLLEYAVSEDGALHAEKFYRTASEEFAAARPAFRWRHACALARVTASAFGQPAPGQAQARELLGA